MVMLDLFSGIGGFPLGLHQAGFTIKKHYYSEINKYAIATYAYRFTEAEYVGSVTDVLRWEIERPNIITFGSPCQDFSIAGKRSGLEGGRSSLIQYAIDSITRFRPDVFIWENVKGVFSSNSGEDFWAIIKAFTDIGGYRLEWQLLNTAWFLPQNRERIYLVGHLRERSKSKVFPVGEGDQIFTNANGREPKEKKRICSTIDSRYGSLRNAGETYIVESKPYELIEDFYSGRVRRYKKDAPTLRGDRIGLKVVPCIRSEHHNTADVHFIKQVGRGFNKGGEHKICPPITSNSFEQNNVVVDARNQATDYQGNIRRLTPTECERFQGFEDNWTKYGIFDGEVKEISDTQRYKMTGNAVSTVVVEAIGKRILEDTLAWA